MSTILPAIKGKIGTNDYFVVTLTTKKAVDLLTIPNKIEGWDTLEIEEQYQREISYSRVKKDIYPYLMDDEDRFFGSLIVAVDKLTTNDFEPIHKIIGRELTNAYKNEGEHIGMLTLKDNGYFIPIDGQHRLAGLKFAIQGKDENGKSIAGHKNNKANIEEDMISLIMLPINLKDKIGVKKGRKIFTKLNKYARPTSSSQNLITNDDDSIAIISREIANKIINENGKLDLVHWKSSQLTDKDPYFTTLDTVYKCNKSIIDHIARSAVSHTIRQEADEEDWVDECKDVWKKLLKEMEVFKILLAHKDDKEESKDKRREARLLYLLAKPIPQQCLFEAFGQMTRSTASPSPYKKMLDDNQAIKKLNTLCWDIGDPAWENVIWQSGKSGDKLPKSKKKGKILPKGKNLMTQLILYMCDHLNDEEEVKFKDTYKTYMQKEGRSDQKLPSKIKP